MGKSEVTYQTCSMHFEECKLTISQKTAKNIDLRKETLEIR